MRTHSHQAAGLCALLITAQAGCTAFGAAIGSQVERPTGRYESISAAGATKLPSKSAVVLYLRDGNRAEGKIESVGFRAEDDYAHAYQRYQQSAAPERRLPDLGDAEFVGDGDPRPRPVRFLGIDPLGIIVQRDMRRPERVRFASVGSLSSAGRKADGPFLRSLAQEGRAPLNAELRLEGSSIRVPIDDIVSIERPVMKNCALQGAAGGLVADGLCFLIIYSALSDLKNADFGGWAVRPE